MSKEYFRHGRYLVTNAMVRARYRSIQLGTVESVELSRPLFLMALAGGGGLLGFGFFFADLLYAHEIILAVLTGAALIAVSWRIGSLRIYSKLTGGKGWTVVGRFPVLRGMRDAVEAALAEHGGDPLFKQHGGVSATLAEGEA